jgi:hypothetical protein
MTAHHIEGYFGGRDKEIFETSQMQTLQNMDENPEVQPAHYRIKIKGHLEDRWADWFENLSFTYGDDGTMTLAGPIADSAALHSVLQHIRNLGLTLISVQPAHTEQ